MKKREEWNNSAKILLLALVLMNIFGCHEVQVAEEPTSSVDVERYFRDLAKAKSIVGASLALLRNDSVVSRFNYGSSHLDEKIPVHNQTRFQLASASKMFTGTLALIFVEKGVMDLDDTLGQFLDDIPQRWKSLNLGEFIVTHKWFAAVDESRNGRDDRRNGGKEFKEGSGITDGFAGG